MKLASVAARAADRVLSEVRIPTATYRLQFGNGFTFRDARAIIPYLCELGVTDCYASPLLKARADSSHGYDVSDHSQLNPAFGTERDFEAWVSALHAKGMGLILDIVPNHMGIGEPSNAWWMDVLENGPASSYASFFDIDWHPVTAELDDRLLLPILEDQYGKVLESGKLHLTYEDGAFFVNYYQTKLPLAPGTWSRILGHQLEALSEALSEDNEHVQELKSILTALSYLPPPTELSPEKIEERNREKTVIRRRTAALYDACPEVREAIDSAVQTYNGRVGDPRSFDLLDDLLDAQVYRLACWRVAAEAINYRRFFDINDLAAIRVELPEVFLATHQLILRLLAEGKASGLRVDHPDGLWNPSQYFLQLQQSYVVGRVRRLLGEEQPLDGLESIVADWLEARARLDKERVAWPLYAVCEKILSPDEHLPADWAVYGTTGYDFLNAVNGLFVDSSKRKALERVYKNFTGFSGTFANLVNASKKMIMLVSMASEINALASKLGRVASANRWYRDFTLNSLTFAIREIIACLPVYRTYIVDPTCPVNETDRRYVEAAVEEAKRRNPRTAESIFDFIRDTLLLRNLDDFRAEDRDDLIEFVMKFQQVTGPVMAKGVEDTAFYVYNCLVSLNEVGGSPNQFGITVAEFHRRNHERLRQRPHSMLSTSTHDTKRGEDVRARIDVLSEMPDAWRAALGRWSRMNSGKKRLVDGEPAPDRNDEYLFYQTLLGAWPTGPLNREDLREIRERLVAYMAKATKEAKVRTSWINPNEEYDAAVQEFVSRVLVLPQEGLLESRQSQFLADFASFQKVVAYFGLFNSLAQALLKLTAPGVPDVYQGTELLDLSLVDPDNRRPVDYQLRRSLLSELKTEVERAGDDLSTITNRLLETWQDGRIKLYLIYRTLSFRRRNAALFASGQYAALEALGEKGKHVCAFARTLDGSVAVTVVPRLVVGLCEGVERPPMTDEVWRSTRLALPFEQEGRRYRDVFTGKALTVNVRDGVPGLPMGAVLQDFPVALLAREPG